MTLQLTKHHGLGNDFLVVFHPPVAAADLPDLAIRLCDRRRGVGADGLMTVESPPADHEAATEYGATMALFNADGSRAEMSGNGIRCFAQALSMRHDGAHGAVTIHTDAGPKVVTTSATDDPNTLTATVDMGTVGEIAEPHGWAALECHPDRPVAHLTMGNPHSVVGVDDVSVVDLADLGSRVPHVNLEIIEPGPEPDAITLRVHERGAGITQACGTGACASAFAAKRWGLVAANVVEVPVHMDGGTATVSFRPDEPTRAILTGPATFVGSIEVPLP